MKEKLKIIISNTPIKQVYYAIKRDKKLYQYILTNTLYLQDHVTMAERIYNILNGNTLYKCKKGNLKKFKSYNIGYKFCGRTGVCECCGESVSKSVSKSKQQYSTKQKKYINEKRIKTTLLKYGVTNNGQTNRAKKLHKKFYSNKDNVIEVNNKYKKILQRKYGVDNIRQIPGINDKIKQTNITRYGVDNPMKLKEIQIKSKQTMINRYNVEYAFQSKEIQDKIKNTNLERYGVEFPSQSKEIQDKIKKTNIGRYGVEFPSMNEKIKIIKSINGLKKSYPKIIERVLSVVKPNFDIYNYKGVQKKHSWSCIVCNSEFYDHLDNGRTPVCHKCYPLSESKGEREVGKYIESLDYNIINNNREIIKPKELDIVISEKKIAIEYCGLYWHSDKHKPSNYHLDKLIETNNAGYRLITIFEDEWINKQEICKDRLKHILGMSNTTCYARQTTIKEISNKEHKDFLITYHIQGFIGAKIKLGAFYKDELVAVMSFGQKRRALGNKIQKDNTYELLRFCTKGSIPGVGSKLFKHFTRNYNPKEIISYCDLRWGTGEFYKNIGFKLSHISGVNYWYSTDCISKEHRYQYRKQALTEMVSYSKDKTEFEIMDEEGYYRIYDCGNKVFKWVY